MGRLDVGIYGSAIFGVVPRVLAREPMLLAATGLGVTLVPASMGNVHFPGIAYRPLKTHAFMDVHCYYPRRGVFAAAWRHAGDGAGFREGEGGDRIEAQSGK